jgi:hypothetical protein
MWTLSIDSGFEAPVTRQVGEVEGLKIQNNLKLDPSHANGEGRPSHLELYHSQKENQKKNFQNPS